jgi:hypothetical protein
VSHHTRRSAGILAGLLPVALAGALVAGAGGTTASAASAGGWRIQTAAGGVGGPGSARGVQMGSPCAVTFSGGQLYIGTGSGSDSEVRSVSLSTGELTTPAGTVDVTGPGASGIAASEAGLGSLCGLTVDGAGNLLIADGGYFSDGGPDDGGPAAKARLGILPMGDGKNDVSEPWPALRVDHHGNLVLGDTDNDVVRVVATSSGTFYGQAMTAGDIYSIAGGGTAGLGDGGPALAAELDGPEELAVAASGDVYVGDFYRVRLLTP